MRILALDTATEACSVGLLTERGLFGQFRELGRGHAEQILEMVGQVLRDSGLSLHDLDGLAASIGPGAFTGVRIGVSIAQGLAFGADLPMVGVTTLEALALKALDAGAEDVMACLDARMGEVYYGCFSGAPGGLVALGPPMLADPAKLKSLPFSGTFAGIGRGFAAYASLRALSGLDLATGAPDELPDARHMARLGAMRFAAGQGTDPADCEPLYLRDKVALTEAERAARKSPAVE